MPIWFNPISAWFGAVRPSPSPPTSSTPSVAVTQAGLFDASTLVNDGALKQLRRAAPPTTMAELTTNDPRNHSVVYKQVSGRGVRLNHGAVIEGSVDFGGLQPNYVVDLKHPRLHQLLASARALNTPSTSFKARVNAVVTLVQKTLTEGAYDAPAYLKLLAHNRSHRTNITLGDYLAHGAGVCRENALLTHLALLEAGITSEYVYCHASQAGRREDHAVAVAVDKAGRKVVVDSYNRNFHGAFLDDLLAPGGSRPGHKRLAGSAAPSIYGCELSIAPYPVYWIPIRALLSPMPAMPPIDELKDFRVVRPAR